MNFSAAFFDELQKLAAKRSKEASIFLRVGPSNKKISEQEWRDKRNLSTIAGAVGPLPTYITSALGGAAPGRAISTTAGSFLGRELGDLIGRLTPSKRAAVLSRVLGGAVGARIGHGSSPKKR